MSGFGTKLISGNFLLCNVKMGDGKLGGYIDLEYRVSALAIVDFLRHLLLKLLKKVLRRKIRSTFRISNFSIVHLLISFLLEYECSEVLDPLYFIVNTRTLMSVYK